MLSSICSQQLDLARLASLDRALGDAAQLERHALLSGADTRAYVDDLLARREDLLSGLAGYQLRDSSGPRLVRPAWVERHLGDIASQLTSGWWNIRAPSVQQAVCFAPGTPTTSGVLDAPYTAYGSVGIDTILPNMPTRVGTPLAQNGGKGPGDEEAWLCSWKWTVVFEPAPADGYLSYRFQVDTTLTPYQASALSGGIYAWINTGTASEEGQELSHWREVMPWPVAAVVPHAQQALHLGRDVIISGWIPVKKNQRAKLGMVAGITVTLAGGQVKLISSDSSITTRRIGSSQIPDIGQVEYRFDPDLFIQLIDDEISLPRKHFP